MRNPLNKRLRQKMYENFKSGPNSAVYDDAGNVIAEKKKKERQKYYKFLKILIPIISVFLVLAGIVYLPQFLIEDEAANELIFKADLEKYDEFLKYLDGKRDSDFDGDGVSNYIESQWGSNPYSKDTDHDGVFDGTDNSPCSHDDVLYTSLLTQGADIDEPYEINGVILWPDDKNSWALGAVIPVQNGYQFTNYRGWAKFPSGKYAYEYSDGKHTILKQKKDANAWYIAHDCKVVLVDDRPENTYKVSFFGKSTYLRNGTGELLAWLLPEKGWITAETMWLDDTFVDTRSNTYSQYQKANTSYLDTARYKYYTEQLTDLAEVYAIIDRGDYVLASLISKEHGESIVEIYGYTNDGDLIVADPQIKSINGILRVTARCSRALDKNNRIVENSWFEFSGCGYDSANGDLIGFFYASNKEDA